MLPALGKEIKADSAPEKKAEGATRTGKANKSPLLAASTYYHPLSPLPNEIDHLAIINFGCNLLYVSYDSISWQTCQTPHF
ncbi:MAG: hypothetical protein WBE46_09740 [Dehalococcoidia bacterium]